MPSARKREVYIVNIGVERVSQVVISHVWMESFIIYMLLRVEKPPKWKKYEYLYITLSRVVIQLINLKSNLETLQFG